MANHTSGGILITKGQNSETVILTFVRPLFHAPLQRCGPIPLLESIRCCIHRICINCLWAVPFWSSNLPMIRSNTLLCLINLLILINKFILYHHSSTVNTEGFSPFCNILILAIIFCSYTCYILYYLCATLIYTAFTYSVWYLHDRFANMYL